MKTIIFLCVVLFVPFNLYAIDGDHTIDVFSCNGIEGKLRLAGCIIEKLCSGIETIPNNERFYVKILTDRKKTVYYLFELTPKELKPMCAI